MTSGSDLQEMTDATVTFERDLERLVLEAFARGARVDGTWEIRPEPDAVPDWTITVERHEGALPDESIVEE